MAGVVHFEIPADDESRARDFYSSAFGWKISPIPEMSYAMLMTTPSDETGMPSVPGSINGGMFRREGDLTSPVVTVDVEDIDAALQKINSLGGSTVRPREEVGTMGWAAYFRDTEGNVVGLWQNAVPEGGTSEAAGTGTAAGGNDIGA
ncbi:putative enzyme related to lactoylglutathione lyase [Arthrobacter sp. V4I6]|uniref:VOC family protein n=1 Tax=unclassified Arthrobacter TaxID=235627 RepID=UPI0027858A41|nr:MULTISPECIES: VOC family protein [unclassified Arthrobacter]MDQ0819877.1 putative enzyme related to lactoylglutathione lyase [Arthrobacter sp. V1I7]MDQ0854058.1 putative enzyme related to lactoylglutathione lyase [Arthrobacter sp. V4I6]